MKQVGKEESIEVKGGAGLSIGALIVLGLSAAISFFIGLFDGLSSRACS